METVSRRPLLTPTVSYGLDATLCLCNIIIIIESYFYFNDYNIRKFDKYEFSKLLGVVVVVHKILIKYGRAGPLAGAPFERDLRFVRRNLLFIY